LKKRSLVFSALVALVAAGLFETAFAVCLKLSNGLTVPWPTVAFAISAMTSFGLLTVALRDLEVGPAYAVWTGIGAAGAATVGMVFLGDVVSATKLDPDAAAFYRARGWRPLWFNGGKIRPETQQLLTTLRNASADNLDPRAYQADRLATLRLYPPRGARAGRRRRLPALFGSLSEKACCRHRNEPPMVMQSCLAWVTGQCSTMRQWS